MNPTSDGIMRYAIMWSPGPLRPPLSVTFAGELLLGERLLVQVQMQVLVMLPPQVLLRCYSVKCSGREDHP